MRVMMTTGTGVLAALLWAAPAISQDAVPQLSLRQLGEESSSAWGNEAVVTLDRDAFVTVYELGADGRIRIVYPETPKENAFRRSERTLRVFLPSPMAEFRNISRKRVPVLIAIASDLRPDLNAFGQSGSRWSYQYTPVAGDDINGMVDELALLTLGGFNIPFGSATQLIAPRLPELVQTQLMHCSFALGGINSVGFYNAMWNSRFASQFMDPRFAMYDGVMSPVGIPFGLTMSPFMPLFAPMMDGRTQRSWNPFIGSCYGLNQYNDFMFNRMPLGQWRYSAQLPFPLIPDGEDVERDKYPAKDRLGGPVPGTRVNEQLKLPGTSGTQGGVASGEGQTGAEARQDAARRTVERLQDEARLRGDYAILGGSAVIGGGGGLQREPIAMPPQRQLASANGNVRSGLSSPEARRRAAYEAEQRRSRGAQWRSTGGSVGGSSSVGGSQGSVGSGSAGSSSSGSRGGSAGGGRGSSSGRGGGN